MTSIESIESAQAFVKAMLSLERRTDTDFRFIAQCIKNTVCASPHRRYFYILDIIRYLICSTTQRKKHSKHYGRYTLLHFGYASLAALRDLCLGTYHTDSTLYRRKETLCE